LQRRFFVYSVVAAFVVAALAKIAGAAIPVVVTLFFAAAFGSYLLLPF
jgi:hypothetical protein